MPQINKTLLELQNNIKSFHWRYFLQDNITGSRYQTAWITSLTLFTALFAAVQFQRMPTVTIVVLVAWIACISMVAAETLFHCRTDLSSWLKNKLFRSVSNGLLTLFYSLALSVVGRIIVQWAFINATFNSEETGSEFRPEFGATWGVLWAARKLILTGRMASEDSPRVLLALVFVLGLWALTYISSKPAMRDKLKRLRQGLWSVWVLSPVILYVFLAGIPSTPFNISTVLTGLVCVVALYTLFWWQKIIRFNWLSFIGATCAWVLTYLIWWTLGHNGIFPPINVNHWGGLMLSLVVACCVVSCSLPIALLLALGRRSKVYGIPAWLTWPVAICVTIWGFTTTPQLLTDARSTIEQIFAFWPIGILVLVYMFQRTFKGNMVAGACTAFIELVRSVPLITVLFMGIIMAPFFFKAGISIAKPWPVIVGYILFQSTYMAEVIRGGLQAIPSGQFEAADALGYNGFQKMRFIILPQALTIVIPALVGQFISAFKSSSLVSIVGLHDLTGIASAIINNPEWIGLHRELYVFLGIVYFIGSFAMSSYSRRLEKQLGVGER